MGSAWTAAIAVSCLWPSWLEVVLQSFPGVDNTLCGQGVELRSSQGWQNRRAWGRLPCRRWLLRADKNPCYIRPIAQNCWNWDVWKSQIKKMLDMPICHSCSLQEGSDKEQRPGWRHNPCLAQSHSRMAHTKTSWLNVAGIGNKRHILHCVITRSSFSCLTPETFSKEESLGSSCPKTRNVKAVVHYS